MKDKITIIRDRGQLTIPETIRKAAPWASALSVVSISLPYEDEIVIKPHVQHLGTSSISTQKKVWQRIQKSRAICGKGKISASAFLEQDRREH